MSANTPYFISFTTPVVAAQYMLLVIVY